MVLYQSTAGLQLPFKSETIDFIVALHILEHLTDPIAVIKDWLKILRPGGGIGLILPDWRYSWDASGDKHPWAHRWNPEPELLKKIYDRELSNLCNLEALDTYDYKLSFDVVLRKPGKFVLFDDQVKKELSQIPTGHDLYGQGKFLGANRQDRTVRY